MMRELRIRLTRAALPWAQLDATGNEAATKTSLGRCSDDNRPHESDMAAPQQQHPPTFLRVTPFSAVVLYDDSCTANSQLEVELFVPGCEPQHVTAQAAAMQCPQATADLRDQLLDLLHPWASEHR